MPDESLLDKVVALGAAAHPTVRASPAVRASLAQQVDLPSRELDARAPDLYLAAACVARDEAAIAILSDRLPAIVRPVLGRLGVPSSDDDEIIQRTRVALLAHDETGACGLASYSGRGDLRSYLRAVALRIALKRVQREASPGPDDATEFLGLLPAPDDTAELALLKHEYRTELRAAFSAGFAALSPRERALLRQHYLDGLTVDLLAPLHQVHRSTCARWLDTARVKVLREVRHYLRRVLGFDDHDLERAVELVKSQLDLSLRRHLAEQPPSGE